MGRDGVFKRTVLFRMKLKHLRHFTKGMLLVQSSFKIATTRCGHTAKIVYGISGVLMSKADWHVVLSAREQHLMLEARW